MKIERVLYWLPRISALFLILFLAIFALDVFVPDQPVLSILIGLLIHLVPNFIMLAALILAWKKERLGGVILLCLGLFFTIFFHTYREFYSFMLVSLPLFAIGFLFLIHFRMFGSKKKSGA